MLTDEEKRILLQNRLFAELSAKRLDGLLQRLAARTACYGKNSVIWGMGEQIDRAGIVGADGETHHGVFDLSYLSGIPNMHVFSPADGDQLTALLRYALSLNAPAAVRYPRGTCSWKKEKLEYHGGNQRICAGRDVDIWAVGSMLDHAEEARVILEQQGYSVGIVSVLQVKPMDLSLLNPDVRLAVTLEDGIVLEGFGAMFHEQAPCGLEVLQLGWPDQFISHGSPQDLYRMYGLDGAGIAESVRRVLEGDDPEGTK